MRTALPIAVVRSVGQRAGVDLVEVPGCETRYARMFTSGYNRGIQAQCLHHTVSSGQYPVNDVNYILRGKGPGFVISNLYTGIDGRMWVLALAGGTYTEGRGGPLGLIPASGATRVCLSNEIANDGTGKNPYPDAQQETVLAFHSLMAEELADLWDWHDDPHGPDRMFSHFEWSPGRKQDPAGEARWEDGTGTPTFNTRMWNMDAYRADSRNYVSPSPSIGDTVIPIPYARHRINDNGQADRTHTIKVAGGERFGAVQVTVTALNFAKPGFVTGWSAGQMPDASFVNWTTATSEPNPNTRLVSLDANGAFKLFVKGRADLIVDIGDVAFARAA